MRLLLVLAVVLLVPAAAQAAALDRRELRVGVETASPPFSELDEFGGFRGFNVDIARALCERMEIACTFVGMNIGDAIRQLQNRVVDLVVASMTITAERQQVIDFTEPYFRSGNRVIAPRGTPSDLSPPALRGKTIGVQRDTTHDRYVSATYGGVATIRRYTDRDELFIDLALGRLDLVISDGLATRAAFLDTELGAGFDFVGPELQAPEFFGDGEAITVRKGDVELRQALNDALEAIRSSGTYATISKGYFGYDVYGR
jgi:arginine/ornithine transport system substrate-binding protein